MSSELAGLWWDVGRAWFGTVPTKYDCALDEGETEGPGQLQQLYCYPVVRIVL